jgi:hypothetical protein
MNQPPIIRKASRKKARLRLGISAPSGAGKTMGALLLAYGITKDWGKIGLIDTEEGSGELYVGVHKQGVTIGEFGYIRISKDFSPVNYTNAIHAFEAANYEVIIIDSLTHAWAGAEGLLQKQGNIAAKTGNGYTAWRNVTPQHDALVNCMLQSPANIIATMRSKVEYAMQKGPDGKTKVEKMGMAPIQREGMEYEFTTFFDIDSNSIASASKDRTDLFSTIDAAGRLDKKHFMLTPKTGEDLLNWLETGKESPDSVAQRLAGVIKASTDLKQTYSEISAQIDEVGVDRPDYKVLLMSLFDKRHEELTNAG